MISLNYALRSRRPNVPDTVNEIPVSCPVCKGRALLNRTDRVVECFTGSIGHKLIFLRSGQFDTLLTLGHLPATE